MYLCMCVLGMCIFLRNMPERHFCGNSFIACICDAVFSALSIISSLFPFISKNAI